MGRLVSRSSFLGDSGALFLSGALPDSTEASLREGRSGKLLTFNAPLENINYAAAATAIFNSARECAGETVTDIQVRVLSDQSHSGQIGTESCGRSGDASFEA